MSITVEPLDDAKVKAEETKLAAAIVGLIVDIASREVAAEAMKRYTDVAHDLTIKSGMASGLDYTPEFIAQAKAVCDRAVARALDFVFQEAIGPPASLHVSFGDGSIRIEAAPLTPGAASVFASEAGRTVFSRHATPAQLRELSALALYMADVADVAKRNAKGGAA